MPEWRDIETAPKDGTTILAFESGIVDVVKYSEIQRAFVRWDDQSRMALRYEPSHWMPLPSPPAQSSASHP